MIKKSTKITFNIVIILVLIAAVCIVCSRFIHLGRVEYTDNAQVRQHITPINSRVPGFIREIRFDDYQTVHQGDTLAVIEDAEFRLHLAQAEAAYANATAGRSATSAGIATTSNNISVGNAGVQEAKVQLENAQRELARYEKLLEQDAVTRQQYDAIRTAAEAAQARYDQASRATTSTSLVRNEQTHRLSQSDAAIQLAQAELDLARLNLSYCYIIATCDGTMGKKDIHVGQLVQPGQTIAQIVDAEDVWVVANYREKQLANISVGNEVSISVDAVPGKTYKGIVTEISAATGTAFSMIPQDNATGNFVKIQQRVPVRISLKDNSTEDLQLLRAGLNVECEVKY